MVQCSVLLLCRDSEVFQKKLRECNLIAGGVCAYAGGGLLYYCCRPLARDPNWKARQVYCVRLFKCNAVQAYCARLNILQRCQCTRGQQQRCRYDDAGHSQSRTHSPHGEAHSGHEARLGGHRLVRRCDRTGERGKGWGPPPHRTRTHPSR